MKKLARHSLDRILWWFGFAAASDGQLIPCRPQSLADRFYIGGNLGGAWQEEA
jgi:hypothetical protein